MRSSLALLCIGFLLTISSVQSATDFTSFAVAFDYKVAYRYLMYAYAAYCPASAIMTWKCYWCTDPAVASTTQILKVVTNTTKSIQGYVAVNTMYREIIVSYRGTDNFQNLVDDLQFGKCDDPFYGISNAYVASGFYNCFKSVEPSMRQAILSAVSTYGYPVYFTGHSLGAALATLSALSLNIRDGLKIGGAIHFGSPRVGNAYFAGAYNARIPNTVRVVNNRDIVPHLPPKIVNFRHVAFEVFQQSTNYKVCDSTGEDVTCADDVSWYSYTLKDHFLYLNVDKHRSSLAC